MAFGDGINTVNNKYYDMDNILNARFGESSSEITVEFKKTVLIRNYETEVVDLMSTVKLDEAVDGMDRALITCILNAQLEIQAYMSLLIRGKVGQTEYDQRKTKILMDVNSMANRYERLTGRSAGKYLELIENRG